MMLMVQCVCCTLLEQLNGHFKDSIVHAAARCSAVQRSAGLEEEDVSAAAAAAAAAACS